MEKLLIKVSFELLLFLSFIFVSYSQAGTLAAVEIPTMLRKTGSRTFTDLQQFHKQPEISNNEGGEEEESLIADLHNIQRINENQNNLMEETHQLPDNAKTNDKNHLEQENGIENSNYNSDYSDEDEENCPAEDEMFYSKSQQCVPKKCSSDTQRDFDTGFCIVKIMRGLFSGPRYGGGGSYWYRGRSLYKAPSKLRIPVFRG